MIYERRYIQFNELVFDSSDMIADYDSEVSFKGESTEYSYGHGSYRPFKREYPFIRERNVSMTITLHMMKLPCEYRSYYIRFVNEQLAKHGKLWSIKNGELMWAIATVDSISENLSRRQDRLTFNINFVLPEGVWHKADKQKTFLVPWNICTFMECKDYKTLNPCDDLSSGDCCTACMDKKAQEYEDCSCCCLDELTKDMELCYHLDELSDYYTCFIGYQIVYDCEHAEKFSSEEHLGQKLCTKDSCESSVIAGRIYSETEMPTEAVTVILKGKMLNPEITINNSTNIIKGEYDGTLLIYPNGDVYFRQYDDCKCDVLLDPSVWSIPQGSEYGWTLYPQNNRVIANLNACCQGRACMWIQHEAIAM